MNPRGFSFHTCQQLIHSCIRPSLEYALPIVPYNDEEIKGLEDTLVSACRRAMGVYKNTSKSGLLKLFQQVPMQQRQKEVSAKWVERTESNQDMGCLITVLRRANAEQQPCFSLGKTVRSKAVLYDLSLARDVSVQSLFREQRQLVWEATRAKEQIPSCFAAAWNHSPLCQKTDLDRGIIRALALWRLGKIPGKVSECPRHPGTNLSRNHIPWCNGMLDYRRPLNREETPNLVDHILNSCSYTLEDRDFSQAALVICRQLGRIRRQRVEQQ
jgi:hypothetical protein